MEDKLPVSSCSRGAGPGTSPWQGGPQEDSSWRTNFTSLCLAPKNKSWNRAWRQPAPDHTLTTERPPSPRPSQPDTQLRRRPRQASSVPGVPVPEQPAPLHRACRAVNLPEPWARANGNVLNLGGLNPFWDRNEGRATFTLQGKTALTEAGLDGSSSHDVRGNRSQWLCRLLPEHLVMLWPSTRHLLPTDTKSGYQTPEPPIRGPLNHKRLCPSSGSASSAPSSRAQLKPRLLYTGLTLPR